MPFPHKMITFAPSRKVLGRGIGEGLSLTPRSKNNLKNPPYYNGGWPAFPGVGKELWKVAAAEPYSQQSGVNHMKSDQKAVDAPHSCGADEYIAQA